MALAPELRFLDVGIDSGTEGLQYLVSDLSGDSVTVSVDVFKQKIKTSQSPPLVIAAGKFSGHRPR